LIIHLLGDAGDGIAETRTIISTVENDYERRTLGHAVEQAGGRGHGGDVKLARDDRRHGERAVHELAMLNLNP